jgi:hypothetical protein
MKQTNKAAYTEPEDKPKRGNPIAQFRYRWQTYNEKDEPMESEWSQIKSDAIKCAARDLIREHKKFGVTDMTVKIFNEMNYKEAPIVMTLEDAYKIFPNT